ncbi:MAG: ABC transporter ATP-binding protein, partial [Sphingobacteriales bacterium]
MSDLAIQVENLSKAYQLGEFSTGTLTKDIHRWWMLTRGKEDPYLKIGETNDRAVKGTSDIVWSLKDINFEIKEGDAVGIIGRNGAGKSTLLKILSRVTAPTTGNINIKGRIASLLEVGTGFHPELTGGENIYLNGAIMGMSKREIKRKFDEIVDFAGVERYIDTPVKRYSSGMYVRLAFAVAAYLDSEILVVDEVLAVGDAEFQKKCIGKMSDVSKGEGRTVLFVSHNMTSIKNLCTRAVLLNNGLIVKQRQTQEVLDQYNNVFVTNTDSSVIIDKGHRMYNLSRDIEYVKLSFENAQPYNQYSTEDNIVIIATIKATSDFKKFRIASGIHSTDHAPVGVFFSDDKLEIKGGETKDVRITIKDHQLAKGRYYFSFSVGIGNEIIGIRDLDIVTYTLAFEICYSDIFHKEMISLWEPHWGYINFK